MSSRKRIGFMIWGANANERSVFTDEKYKGLADFFQQRGLAVESIVYNNTLAEALRDTLYQLDGLLVWVNPIEHGDNRDILDQLLTDIIAKGVMVSSRPGTILKIGTKKVLYETCDMPWGGDVRQYDTLQVFKSSFWASLERSRIRVLKQYRGDGGNGVFKISLHDDAALPIAVLHAKRGSAEERVTFEGLCSMFAPYFENGRPLIDQEWNPNLTNGVVRCYLSGTRVAGFGYQEINALYPSQGEQVQPGRRYYYTENCGLFQDLRHVMEANWLYLLATKYDLGKDDFPVIWDCDFFINDFTGQREQKYALCEINVSCVSPFPESAIPRIYDEVKRRIEGW